eukprot:2597376-Amphidinium_carterae.2
MISSAVAFRIPRSTLMLVRQHHLAAELVGVDRGNSGNYALKVGTEKRRMIIDRRPRNACEMSAELALAPCSQWPWRIRKPCPQSVHQYSLWHFGALYVQHHGLTWGYATPTGGTPRQSGAIRWRDLVQEETERLDAVNIRCPEFISLASSMDCSLVTSFRFSHSAHVNVQEAVALRTAVKAACRSEELHVGYTNLLLGRLHGSAVNLVPRSKLFSPAEPGATDGATAHTERWLETYNFVAPQGLTGSWPSTYSPLVRGSPGRGISPPSIGTAEAGSVDHLGRSMSLELLSLSVPRSELEFDSTKCFPGEGPVGFEDEFPLYGASPHADADLSVAVQPRMLRRQKTCWQRLMQRQFARTRRYRCDRLYQWSFSWHYP